MTFPEAAPGDVLAVGGYGGSIWQRLIRAGEALRGLPGVANHVVIVTHIDTQGRWMGIQGQPGGVGPCDCTPYLSREFTRTNHLQPRADDKRQTDSFLASAAKSLGIAYDWTAIAEDALDAVDLHDLSEWIDPIWRWPTKDGLLPGHLVCSSLAAELYRLVGWAHPNAGDERNCEPADWWKWSDLHQWQTDIR